MIGRLNDDGSITGIYCHFDGYLSYVGRILAEHYTDAAKVDALMALGDLSALGEEIGEKHDFRNCPKGQCNAYGRDRGERNVDARTFETMRAFADDYEYAYLFVDGAWTVSAPYASPPLAWFPLSEAVAIDAARRAAEVAS
jgi:hypothetical protein